jgi:hypothetical protein
MTSQPSIENLEFKTKRGSTTPLTPDALPGLLPSVNKGINLKNYKVRYQKLDLNELGDVTELERIETLAIRDEGIYLLSKKDFIFMDKIFMIVSYLEKVDPNEPPVRPIL